MFRHNIITWLMVATFILERGTTIELFASGNSNGINQAIAANEIIPTTLEWSEVDKSRRAEILEMLITQAKGNYEKIRTWQGNYSFQVITYLSPAFVADAFGNRLPTDRDIALRQELSYDLAFAIDVPGNRLFLERVSKPTRYLEVNSDMEVVIPGTMFENMNSVVTSERYLYVYPDRKMTYAVLPDHPEAQRKRAAHRVPKEQADGQNKGDVPDPRQFFRSMNENKFVWENLRGFLTALPEPQSQPRNNGTERMVVDQADDDGNNWYRVRIPLEYAGGETTIMTSIWSPIADYNLVQLEFSSVNPMEAPASSLKLQWKAFDGVFIPSVVNEIVRSESLGINSYQRQATLKQCSVNDPIKPDQFDYRGLGLVDGDLVLDEIEEVVYKIEHGKPIKLANFGERNATPLSERLPSSRRLMIAATLAIIVVLLVLIWRRRVAGA